MSAQPVSPAHEELGQAHYLGPARVVRSEGAVTIVALPDGREQRVELALAYAYEPEVGDVLVVIGSEERWYVIGVVGGSGKVHLHFPGDVELCAEGELSLRGKAAVDIEADEVTLRADRMKVVAHKLAEVADTIYQRVRGLWSLRSESLSETVEGERSLRAERASIATEKSVELNGEEIHLG